MTKRISFLLFVSVISYVVKSQTLYRTYYDYAKAHVKEEYYANSYGVKNGSYKMFSEYGGVLVQGAYKDDKAAGKWIVYNDKGKKKSELNYKDDLLDGFAIYYDDTGIKKLEGNFTNGVKTGDWHLYEIYQTMDWTEGSNGNIPPRHADVPKSAIVGCEYVKILVRYKQEIEDDPYVVTDPGSRQVREYGGELAQYEHGHIIDLFYPSGKKYQEGIANNKGGRDFYRYYPNGKLEQYNFVDTTNNTVSFEKKWQYPGGTMDSVPYYLEQKKKQVELAQHKVELAQHKQDSLNEISRKEAELAQHKQDSLNEISRKEAETKQKIGQKSYTIDSLYKVFKGIYVGSKQSIFFVDPRTHKPIVSTTYPHGEHLFLKSDTLIKFMCMDFQKETDIKSQLNKSINIIILLNKVISLSNTDTKSIDKQCKKAETMDDIKKILEVQ